MRARSPSQFFFREFKMADGSRAMGQIGTTLEDYNVRTFILPRRFFVVANGSAVRPGQVLIDGRRKYLLLDHAERSKDRSRLFKMAEITYQVVWKHSTQTEDLVTGLAREDRFINKGTFDAALEYIEPLHDNQNRKIGNFRMLIGEPVSVGDKIDEKTVKLVEPIQGVYFAEVQ